MGIPIPSGRCLPSGFGMNTRRTGCGRYVFAPQFGRQFVQPPVSTPYASMSSNVWPSTPGAPSLERQRSVGEFQDVPSVHLVVQPVEPIAGRSLRFGMQRRPGVSEPSVEVRGSRQSPGSRALSDAGLELRPLPSTGVTRLPRYRVGGGAPKRWPPSAAQTGRAVFPHPAFTKAHARRRSNERLWQSRRTSPSEP